MSTKKIRLISAAMAGGLVLTGATTVAIATSGHAPVHAVLATDITSSPPVSLDNCPTLAEGYQGGCATELQTELNADINANLTADGAFGAATKQAVINFQNQNDISPADGIVGPQTKAALVSADSVATPQPGPAQTASPDCSQDATQGPPSASIPPSQQSYFQCQPPGVPGKQVNGTACAIGLGTTALGAAAGPAAGLLDIFTLGSLGGGIVGSVLAC
jgi:peptidoglycan hydrolase-like protein with peptidoglycan-binding domain